ncbi:protein TALPID3 [Hyperolius riggenbachi]|uniref:protein TALPID3 n=1 Tax=Hyperolius riggenbachi TaxID=752182 RepID=UPI0035A3B784
MLEEGSDISLDSMASTTASDVLIRSTSVQMTGSLKHGGSRPHSAGRELQRDDHRYGVMDVLDTGMVAARHQDSPSFSGISRWRTEHRQRENIKGSTLKNPEEKEHAPHRMAFRGDLEFPLQSRLDNRHGDICQESQKNGQVIMGNPERLVSMGGGHEASQRSEVSSQMGLSQGSMRQSSPGEAVQDRERSTVQISVKRVREIPAPLSDFTIKQRDPAYVPPALTANKYPAVRLALMEGTPGSGSDLAILKSHTSKNKSPKVLVTKHFQDGADENVTRTLEGSMQKKKDVQISQFTTGQKETLLAALNKRVQSGPVTKEVRVHLLEDAATSSKRSTESADKRDCGDVHPAAIAAATAAAIAAAAPVLKVQSDLEAQVSSVSQLLNKLQEADKQLQRLTEQQSKMPSQPIERPCQQERVSELERQLAQLTEQRLQHLEKLQQQQLEMQSQFMTSAIKASVNPPEHRAPAYSHIPSAVHKQPIHQPLAAAAPRTSETAVPPATTKSPLETPAPRRFAPQPISMDLQRPPSEMLGKENKEEPKNQGNPGKVNFLQQILAHDGSPVSRSSYRTHTPLDLSTVDGRPFSDCLLQNDGVTAVKSSALSSSTAVQKANDVLQDLSVLKQEMQNMMKDAKQWNSQTEYLKPTVSSTVTPTPLLPTHSFRRSVVDPPKSMFEDAERILREVQSNKRVLEDNLKAIIRAKDGAAVYSLINTLATNSNGAEKIRIQKAVDSWITEMTSEIQEELSRKDVKKKKPEDIVQGPSMRRNVGIAKDVKYNREREIKAPARSALRTTKPAAGASAKVQAKPAADKLIALNKRTLLKTNERSKCYSVQKADESSLIDEEVLNRVYGTPMYQGHRSTLKKGPYLRFSSPSPKSKPKRPKVLETVRGVKVKSAKIQTGSHDLEKRVTKVSHDFSVPKDIEPQYVFTPAREPVSSSVPMKGHLIPMAIPLGRSRFDGAAPLPSAVILTRPQPITVNVSVPPQSPKPQLKVLKPNIAVVEMKSEKDPPQLSVQVLPCVDIDSIASDSPATSQRTPSVELPPRTPSPVQPDIQLPVNVETEEEVLALPGSSFQAAELMQDDEIEEAPEPLLELNGWGDTNPPQDGGIPFPPPAPAPHTDTDILDGIIRRRETLENRLVDWVEQEIMARVIGEMHPFRRDAVPDVSTSSSDRSEEASDIVEAAGGEGLQLFVDAGMPVDSGLIRKYVNEALAEMIAIMLGERDSRPVPAPRTKPPDVQLDPVEIAEVPTPQCTPPTSPLPSAREPPTVKTPDLSPQTSIEETELQQDQVDDTSNRSLPVHVDTPTITPAPSPPRVTTPTPVPSEQELSVTQTPPPKPWGSVELPLEEENPHSAIQHKDAVEMSVAADEEPSSLISAATPEPEQSVPVPPKQRTPSPEPSSAVSAPSTAESSTITETDSTDRPISEGEIVYSFGQVAAARALAEGGVVYPNLMESLSSTLKDANDMEFDPPSEGQVIRGPHRGAHRDPVLSLLATCNQGLVAPHEGFYHPESSMEDSSMGEISEGQRPRLTTAAEQVLVGHSVFMDRAANAGLATGRHQNRPSSPGQCPDTAGVAHGDADNISSGPMSIGDLDSQLMPAHYPHPASPYHIPAASGDAAAQGPGRPQKEHQPVPTRFIQVGVKTDEGPHLAAGERLEQTDRTLVEPSVYLTSAISGEATRPIKNMLVTLPTTSHAEEDIQTPSAGSDSSGADTF